MSPPTRARWRPTATATTARDRGVRRAHGRHRGARRFGPPHRPGTAPRRLPRPRPLLPSPDRLRIALVGTRAGLLAGDDLRLDVSVGPGARLELVEPSGLVAYDHRGGTSSWRARVDIAEGGELHWDARPFVISTGARVERSMEVSLAAGARMLWRDTLVLGRSGERGGGVRATTHATYDGCELLVEDLDLMDPEMRELPGILGPNRVIGSVTALGTAPGGQAPPVPHGPGGAGGAGTAAGHGGAYHRGGTGRRLGAMARGRRTGSAGSAGHDRLTVSPSAEPRVTTAAHNSAGTAATAKQTVEATGGPPAGPPPRRPPMTPR